jgi:hypothetical protein
VHFDYADSEIPERDFRPIRADQSIALRVGSLTKRILEIRFGRDVLEGLPADHSWLDGVLTDLSSQIDGRQAMNTLSANVRVVQLIMQRLTSEFVRVLGEISNREGAAEVD